MSATSPALNMASVDRAHAELGGQLGIFVDVQLGDLLTLPWNSTASSSRLGAIILHGPHHSAQNRQRRVLRILVNFSLEIIDIDHGSHKAGSLKDSC